MRGKQSLSYSEGFDPSSALTVIGGKGGVRLRVEIRITWRSFLKLVMVLSSLEVLTQFEMIHTTQWDCSRRALNLQVQLYPFGSLGL